VDVGIGICIVSGHTLIFISLVAKHAHALDVTESAQACVVFASTKAVAAAATAVALAATVADAVAVAAIVATAFVAVAAAFAWTMAIVLLAVGMMAE